MNIKSAFQWLSDCFHFFPASDDGKCWLRFYLLPSRYPSPSLMSPMLPNWCTLAGTWASSVGKSYPKPAQHSCGSQEAEEHPRLLSAERHQPSHGASPSAKVSEPLPRSITGLCSVSHPSPPPSLVFTPQPHRPLLQSLFHF